MHARGPPRATCQAPRFRQVFGYGRAWLLQLLGDAVRTGGCDIVVPVRCRRGRHRSVAMTTMLFHGLELFNPTLDVHVLDYMGPPYMSSSREGRGDNGPVGMGET